MHNIWHLPLPCNDAPLIFSYQPPTTSLFPHSTPPAVTSSLLILSLDFKCRSSTSTHHLTLPQSQPRYSDMLHEALAPSIRAMYTSGTHSFIHFCLTYNCINPDSHILPASEHTLMLFRYLAYSHKPQSIKVYLFSVRNFHLDHGFADPLVDALRLRRLLRGIKRVKGTRLPITPRIFRLFRTHLNLAYYDHLLIWIALLVACFGFLRSSELLAINRKDITTHRAGYVCHPHRNIKIRSISPQCDHQALAFWGPLSLRHHSTGPSPCNPHWWEWPIGLLCQWHTPHAAKAECPSQGASFPLWSCLQRILHTLAPHWGRISSSSCRHSRLADPGTREVGQ